MSLQELSKHPFSVLWRTALVRLPRAVPPQILRFTSEKPFPVEIELPSRGKHQIPVFAFVPDNISYVRASNLPIIIDFHGGGFFLGSCLEQAPFCAKLARELRCVVLTVDYRMGPIDKFPAAVEDAEDVLGAVLNPKNKGYLPLRYGIKEKLEPKGPFELDQKHVALSGFSSGGNLALNLALSIDADAPHMSKAWPSVFPDGYPSSIPLLLFYPSFDARLLPSERTRPAKAPIPSPFWSEVNDLLQPTYLPREQTGHPRASPGLADLKALHKKAKMLLILSELDSLSEQSEAWVKKVQDGGRGKDLKVERYFGMKHGWTQMPDRWLGEDEKKTKYRTYDDSVNFVRDVWEGKELAKDEGAEENATEETLAS